MKIKPNIKMLHVCILVQILLYNVLKLNLDKCLPWKNNMPSYLFIKQAAILGNDNTFVVVSVISKYKVVIQTKFI